ncbi:hypothetical protein ASESINO_237 [Erwinia phage vB_EamM_Asesino]|uniref:Uncharacterized protein n=1 Tax=Erwinia phage vB_EamM_Asesino TaxID=1883370 RepID=A0A1B2IAG8_9CAUD|nr:hypothetical protein ASESINO_237 [Erwinia phage vB_EamM_Asesino]ANZ48250.1 hypothetical protein ASESINO_237 [Erwinia phage vB_EamM_Asesino]
MKIKLLTRELGTKVDMEIYLTPAKLDENKQPTTVGKILSITSLPTGKRVVEIEIDDRNKNRFRDIKNPNPKDLDEVTDWVETYFEVWHKRRLLLSTKKR